MPGLTVLKLGGSVLTDTDAFDGAVREVRRWLGSGDRVIAVVSALAGATDALIDLGRRHGTDPDPHATAQLLATGEHTSAALLALALTASGIPARAVDEQLIGFRVTGDPLDATPDTVDRAAIERLLDERPVLVVPGFVGRDDWGRPCVLGRGGSDLTALILADVLDAHRCRLIKDVDGLYERDPKLDPDARRYSSVSYDDALTLDPAVVQHKAVALAREHALTFEVGALDGNEPTVVSDGPTRLRPGPADASPLRTDTMILQWNAREPMTECVPIL